VEKVEPLAVSTHGNSLSLTKAFGALSSSPTKFSCKTKNMSLKWRLMIGKGLPLSLIIFTSPFVLTKKYFYGKLICFAVFSYNHEN